MKRALIFPGQGAQFVGMGKELCAANSSAMEFFEKANDILGFRISDTMFEGTEEELKQTKVTQPAIFIYALAKLKFSEEVYTPAVVAGHSLGEFTALVANGTLSFESALKLVSIRAEAMQKACEDVEGTMAAILGLEDEIVEQVCEGITEVVVAANYNCPGQLVISGSNAGIDEAITLLQEKGARRALKLPVRGAFHSPLMASAKGVLAEAVDSTVFNVPSCPVVQNVNAQLVSDPAEIKSNLIEQLTSPVRWTQTMHAMQAQGVEEYIESGARVLSGFFKRLDRSIATKTI